MSGAVIINIDRGIADSRLNRLEKRNAIDAGLNCRWSLHSGTQAPLALLLHEETQD